MPPVLALILTIKKGGGCMRRRINPLPFLLYDCLITHACSRQLVRNPFPMISLELEISMNAVGSIPRM